MAWRMAMLRSAREGALGVRRWGHTAAQPAPLQAAIDAPINNTTTLPPLVLPEDGNDCRIGLEFPNLPFVGGSMELMAVPKKKVSPHKRGIRNGPKALKPVPVIVRCKVCGRVKLPHFFCCSGIKKNPGEE
ncbi:uncharacterized protein LOC127261335 [Andrographis paniculata]|uniref:uncharacterized protein LOC127261335 n=1 Tax=Andrographis paniculata TaxID=175694 RepID=UPI0021E75A43|nr:uncharacterized protein LOC127261335 [Andrographis paniculata]